MNTSKNSWDNLRDYPCTFWNYFNPFVSYYLTSLVVEVLHQSRSSHVRYFSNMAHVRKIKQKFKLNYFPDLPNQCIKYAKLFRFDNPNKLVSVWAKLWYQNKEWKFGNIFLKNVYSSRLAYLAACCISHFFSRSILLFYQL